MRRVRDRERKYLARKTKAGRLKRRLEYLAAARKQHPLPPADGWSWIDRRFVREHAPRLSHEAILLYFFLAAVSDQNGLSFYREATIAVRLRITCAARDPESKGIVEGGVRYVKRSALAGRSEELATWEDYRRLAPQWRDEVANVRLHAATKERPIDRFQKERDRLRGLPAIPFDTDEILSVVVTPHARVHYDGNRYSVPPALVRKPVTLRANATEVWILDQGQEVARRPRCYEKGQLLVQARPRCGAAKEEFFRLHDCRRRKFRLVVERCIQVALSWILRWRCLRCGKRFTDYPPFRLAAEAVCQAASAGEGQRVSGNRALLP